MEILNFLWLTWDNLLTKNYHKEHFFFFWPKIGCTNIILSFALLPRDFVHTTCLPLSITLSGNTSFTPSIFHDTAFPIMDWKQISQDA